MTVVVVGLVIAGVVRAQPGGTGRGNSGDPRIGFTFPDSADYSALTWTDAFKAAHDKYSRE